ncbi:MAG: MFS transporter [Promethearchaeota archaeon]|nr:MAG: MFS transporter [Candidatus Lokiarchaeota archaeon]
MNLSIKSEFDFELKQTFYIGFGYLTIGIARTLYSAQVGVILYLFLGSYNLVGAWFAFDNIIRIIIQPLVGKISDNTKTKLGKRLPYIIVGIPSAVIFLILISTINLMPINPEIFWLLIFYMFLFNFSMAFYRAPATSLIPDSLNSKNRSKGNAIGYFMQGIGGILAYIISFIIIKEEIPITFFLTTSIVGIIMIISLIIIVFKVNEREFKNYNINISKESNNLQKNSENVDLINEKTSILSRFRNMIKKSNKNQISLLCGVFSWFVVYKSLEGLFPVFAFDILDMGRGDASGLLLFFAISFISMALPSGILGSKLGRKNVITFGLIIFLLACFLIFIFQIVIIIIIGFILCGFGWAFININALAYFWNMVKNEKIGSQTGLYYVFSLSASTFGPFIIGLFLDLIGTQYLFLLCCFFLFLGLIFLSLVNQKK